MCSLYPLYQPPLANSIGNTTIDRSLAQCPYMSFALLAVEHNMFRLPVFAHNSLPFIVKRLKMQVGGEKDECVEIPRSWQF